jgi:antitoxin component of MazEF toxin-antitoxin module
MPSKTERNLISLGDSYVVVVPKHWVQGQQLEPGSRLELTYDEDIVIKVKKQCRDE